MPATTSDPERGARRGPDGRWLAGASPNPEGRPPIPADVRQAAGEYTIPAVKALARLLKSKNEQIVHLAARELLDRRWGKAVQPMALAAAVASVDTDPRSQIDIARRIAFALELGLRAAQQQETETIDQDPEVPDGK
jgi:hypothetical protein